MSIDNFSSSYQKKINHLPLSPWSIWQLNSWQKNTTEQTILWLTPNQRLKRLAITCWRNQQQYYGLEPNIDAVDTWLCEQFRSHTGYELVPSWAEAWLFRSVVAKEYHHSLKQMVQAERWAYQYKLDQDDMLQHGPQETKQLLHWCQDRLARLKRTSWRYQSHVWQWLNQQQRFKVPYQHVVLVYFLELATPLQTLCHLFKQSGIQVWQEPVPQNNGEWHPIQVSNQRQEIDTMCCVLKQHIEQQRKTLVIVPHLEQHRLFLQRELLAQLAPQHLLNPHVNTQVPWNISGGMLFNQFPQVKGWLAWMHLHQPIWHRDEIICMLRDPWLPGYARENLGRTKLSHQIEATWPVHVVATAAELALKPLIKDIPIWANLFQDTCRCWQIWEQQPTNDQKWVQRWLTLLAKLYWHHGEQALGWDTQHYQMHQAILYQHEQWELLAPLFPKENKSLSKWVEDYQEWLSSLELPVQSSYDAPIQILGPLEAAGLPADEVWLWHATQQDWPVRQARNPFLPLAWNIEHHLPHASEQREFEYTKQLQSCFGGPNAKCFAIWPLAQQGTKQSISQVINPVISSFDLPQKPSVVIQKRWGYEHTGKSLRKNSRIHSGISALYQHDLCPFQSYALLHLQIKTIRTSYLGLAGFERGQLLHHALAFLLENKLGIRLTGDRQHFDSNDYDQAASRALSHWRFSLDALHPAYFQVCLKHLTSWLESWWTHETLRLPFTIKAIEQSWLVQLGNLQFKTRLDRLDETDTHKTLLIDYKSKWSLKKWWTQPLTYPQLPVYALSLPSPPDGFMIQSLQPPAFAYHGVSSHEQYPGCDIEPDWQNLLNQWRIELEQASEQLRSGDARLAPRQGHYTCQKCHLSSLCRRFDRQSEH